MTRSRLDAETSCVDTNGASPTEAETIAAEQNLRKLHFATTPNF